MAEVNIPDGYGIPLANLTTGRLPQPTMDAMASLFAPKRPGQIVLVLDDGIARSHSLIAIPRIEAVGGKVNLALIGNAMSEWMRDAANRGHQIMAHSQTHVDMTTLDAAGRLAQWDSQASISTYVGKPITTWVYPMSAYNDTTATEAWLRFDRVFAGVSDTYRWPAGSGAHFMGRLSWTNATHASVLAELDTAGASGETIIIYTHATDGTNLTQGVTIAQFDELVARAQANGMTFKTVDEAFLPLSNIRDAGFEAADVAEWWSPVSVGGAGTVVSAIDTPDINLAGTRSLKITRTLGTGNTIVTGRIGVPVEAGVEYTLSGRVRLENKTTGSGGATIVATVTSTTGVNLGATISTQITANTGWTKLTVVFTPPAGALSVGVACRLVNSNGDAFFDHLHIDKTSNGVRG